MDIILGFDDSISEAYKQKLQTFVNDLIAQGITANRPPCIWFSGIIAETSDKISLLRRDYKNRLTPEFRWL